MSVCGAAEVFGGVVLGKVSDIVGRKISVTFAMTCYSVGLVLSWLLKTTG